MPMNPHLRRIILLAMIIGGAYLFATTRPVLQPPGILAPDPPLLKQAVSEAPLTRNDIVLKPLSGFSAHARVISLQRYAHDRYARVAPYDLALGWDRLSDSQVLKVVDFAQHERRLLFQSHDPSLPDTEIERRVVNLHVVPGDAEIEARLGKLRRGHLVRIEGRLVETAGDFGRWVGNARTATPAMPATLLWLDRLEVIEPQ